MLLVCAWRTIKEISLLFSRLGQIGIQDIQDQDKFKFISFKQVSFLFLTSNLFQFLILFE